ncbi:MAG: CPBP family intramembrane glutamic endopeptidase [Candidatus Hodarchaeota archaeon]
MSIQLGSNPWLLIGLSSLEILFVLLPALIAGKIEKKGIKEELIEMGFKKNQDPLIENLLKIFSGIGIGILLYATGGFIIYFYRDIIIKFIFGTYFVQHGDEGAISTQPIEPSIIQVIIIIVLQVLIIGICEEAFFRAFLINKFKNKMRLRYAFIFATVLFTLYHVPPFLVPITTMITFFGYYFSIGILFSFIFIYFNYSLIPVSIAHSLFNILIIVL